MRSIFTAAVAFALSAALITSFPGKEMEPSLGGEEEKVLDGVRQGSWAVWEQGVYFVNPESRQTLSAESYSFAAGRTTRVPTMEKGLYQSGPSLTATADGRSILYVHIDQTESDIMPVENFS